jgi:hypothetical protein
MSKYYEVLVQLKVETENGKGESRIKKVSELYLVDALSVTEAEARVVKAFQNSGYSQDYAVVSVRGSKVLDVIFGVDEKEKAELKIEKAKS